MASDSDEAITGGRFKEFSEVWKITNDNFFDSSHNNIDWVKTRNEYTQRLESGADEHELTKNLVQLLGDKYSRLLDKSVFEGLWKYDAIGVGLLFQSEPNKPMFVSAPPISGSSAAKAGIQQNDVIYSINGISTEGMTAVQLLDMMSNDNSDTVTLLYGPEKKSVTLARSTQKATNPVSFYSQKLRDGKVAGYVRLSEFNAEAVPGLKAALNQLNAEGVEEVLLDLRGNTGGGFQFALNIGGMFMVRCDGFSVLRIQSPHRIYISGNDRHSHHSKTGRWCSRWARTTSATCFAAPFPTARCSMVGSCCSRTASLPAPLR